MNINKALEYIVQNQHQLIAADQELLDSVDMLLTINRWELTGIASSIETYDDGTRQISTDEIEYFKVRRLGDTDEER